MPTTKEKGTPPNLSGSPDVQSKDTDQALVARAQAGDREAYGALIERHQRAVAGMLLSVLHDPELAEETAQNAFIKAFQSLAAFEGRSSFKTWVSRIALNEAWSQKRWERLRGWVCLDGWPEDGSERGWADRLRVVAAKDESEELCRKLELEKAMESLSPREREVTAMRLEGYLLCEIAETLQVSEGTVKSTLFDATRKMRSRL